MRWRKFPVFRAHAKKELLLECKQNAKKDGVLEDWINRLPADILVNIISRLTVREAARTMVLSKRWKYLWTFITSLNFDASEELLNLKVREDALIEENWCALKEERSKYMSWVNKVLESHLGSNMNQFRVCFDLRSSETENIDNWVSTAFAKGVEEFELNLHPYDVDVDIPFYVCDLYRFPQDYYNYLKSPRGLHSTRILRSLVFDSVCFTGPIIEFFIHNCPLLERLRVSSCVTFSTLEVVGSSIPLKYLEVIHCPLIMKIEISAPCLVSLVLSGDDRMQLIVGNVPRLVDASIISPQLSFIGPNKSFLDQLETLELKLLLKFKQNLHLHFLPCGLPKLRHLTLHVIASMGESLVGLTCIIDACPFLQKLTLKLAHDPPTDREMCQFPKSSLQHLRVVELIWFVGRAIETEFAVYLFENATMLEKMIVEPLLGSNESQSEARERAKMILQNIAPESVELVIY